MALTRPRYSQIPDTDWKQSVRVATTEDVGNVMLAAMPNTVDGVTLSFYDRVLVRSQANAAQNGIYQVIAVGTGSNGIWERTKDASSGGVNGAVTPSIVTMVEEGTVNKNRTFKLTTTGNIALGTTDLSFGVQAAEAAGSTGQLQFANINNVIGGAQTTSYDYVSGNLSVIGGNLVTTNLHVTTTSLYQNGKRVPQVFSSATPPGDPAEGDQWYQIGTDVLYEWINDGGTSYWVDVSGATIANINPITGETIGQLTINGGQDSVDVNSGALQVVGGVGITGNLNVGGAVSFGGGQLGSDLVISSNTTSTSETTGAIRIASPGGLGVGGNIWAGGAIVANSRIPSTSISTGAIVLPGAGGLGVGGNIWAGGNITALGTVTGGSIRKTTSSTPPVSPVIGDQWYQTNTDILYQYVNDGTSSYWVDVTGATVANISAYNQQSLNDIAIVSGTPSTDETTGALVVSGGVGITGNLNLVGNLAISGGNIIANQNVTSTNTTTGSMVVTGQGGIGVGGNINIGGHISAGGNLSVSQSASFAQNVDIAANLIVSGTYFSAAGFSSNNGNLYAPGFTVTNGNISSTGTTATIGGLTITNGAFGDIASLGVIGSATIGSDLAVTGNITGGGLRKYAQINAPTNPIVGDVWYKTDTDVYYTYVNDGTNKYWIDYTSATVSNANPNLSQSLTDVLIVSGTPATNTTSGALQVQGGAGITGNLYAANVSVVNVSADIFTYANGVSILEGNQGTYSNANVTAYLLANDISLGGNLSAGGTYFTAGGLTSLNGNITATGARADIGGLVIENGSFGNLASLSVIGAATIGGDVTITGNVTGGGIRKTQSINPPANPVVGDLWYKTDTDVMYQYISDGTSKFWVDYVSATVSNASPTSPQSLQDLQIVSGTASTDSSTGALTVVGGIGATGNLNLDGNATIGNVATTTIAASSFTYANGVSILAGNEGTYSNANVTAYLTANDISVGGNLTAGTYFSAGGLSVINGNLTATGTTATVGGLTITAGGIGDLATLGVLGSATIGGDLAVTGNITGGGLRKTQSINPPANPVVGDLWYKTDTDVMYQYINDGTSKFWVDYVGATVSNASPTSPQSLQDLQIVSGTESTSTSSGALIVQGGAGISGNVFAGNLSTATISASNFTYANGVSILAGNEGTYSNANVTAYLTARTTTISDGFLSTAGMTVTAGNLKTTSANIGGLVIENGSFADLASLGVIGSATIGGDLAVTGNITGGGVNKYAQTSAPTNPVPGDIWYKTDTDVYYTFVNDGTSRYWIDYVGATVSNAAVNNSTSTDILFSSGTASTDPNTGAVRVIGGVGIDGDVNASGDFAIGGTFTADAGATVGYLNVTDGVDSYGNVIIHGPGTENYTVQVRSSDAADDVFGIKTSVSGGGFSIDAMNSELTGATPMGISANTFSIGIKNSVGSTVQADALKVNTAGNVSIAKTLSVGQHLAVIGNVSGPTGTFTSVFAGTANLTTLNLSGTLTVPTLNVTTSIDAPGIRKYAQISAPASPATGDVWYKTDTDVYYTYVNDGTNSYWIDYVGATVSNAAVDNSVNQDFRVASGTESTNTDTGALTVVGGVGIVGNIFAGGIVSAQGQLRAISGVQSTSTTTGALVVTGGLGVSANTNIGGALAADSLTIAGPTNLSGNLSGTNMSLSGRADIIGGATIGGYATIGGNLDVTGRITGGGIRKTTSISAPSNPVVGDLWYKTDTDVLYQFVNDGTTNYWVDYVGPTVSNASPSTGLLSDLEIVTGTSSTSTTTGAARITGGVGITENLNVGGVTKLEGNLVAASGTASTNTTTGAIVVDGGIGISGATWIGQSANIGTTLNVVGSTVLGTTLTIGGDIGALANISIAGRADITSDLNVTGNIVGGGVRKTASTTAPANPVPGDVWYKTDTDVYYTYINDGSSSFWVDYVGATVSNAAVDNSTNVDFTITSGTPSTDSSTGALRVAGGFGITGSIYADGVVSASGNIVANATTASTNTTTGALVVKGGVGIAGAVYTGSLLSVAGNISGSNLATGQINTSGNLYLGGSTSIAGRADIVGYATIGGNLDVTGAVTGGGIRKTSSTTAPVNPVVGDVWYKTDTDVYYTYVNDGTSNYWIDYVGATVSNAAVDNSTNQDFSIASGTDSTSTGTGALTVVGGVGTTGNLYVGGLVDVAGNISANNLSVGKIVATDIASANINAAYATLSGALQTTLGASIGGNLTAAGTYFSAGGLSVTSGDITTADFSVVNGNIVASGSTATIGGLTITDGGIGSLASLSVIGDAGIGGNLTVTGTVTGGGIRKTTSTTAPLNPVVGDLWYKQDTDVMYQYVNDGTSTYWVDFVGATVANAVANAEQLNYDLVITTNTPSTDSSTGAIRVSGGVGVIGNLNVTGDTNLNGPVVIAGTLEAGAATLDSISTGGISATNIDANNIVATGAIATIGNLTGGSTYFRAGGITGSAGNLTASGTYFSAGGLSVTAGDINTTNFSVTNGNIVATGQRAELGGLVIENGAFADIASLGVIGSVDIGGDLAVTGNITGGGLRKTQSTTPPANPVQGDIWYKTDSDIYYQYISDGTSSFWIDYTSAAVANVTQSAETVGDLHIASGTPSTDPTTGALRVAGGVGVVGDVNISSNVTVGNVNATTVYSTGVLASSFTYPNGASILDGYYFGTYSNANVGGYLTAQGIGTDSGNLTASGSYFQAGGISSLAGVLTVGNIISSGSKAVVGGLTIENGGFADIASLGVIGSATIGGDVTITGNVTGGGIRKTTSTTAPANPIVGDLWYKSDTDTLYQYLNDGASTYWIDIVGAAVSNRAVERSTNEDFTIASATPSTDIYTGALKVVGGAGITGNVYVGNNIVAGDNLTVTGNTSVTNLTASGAITGLSISAGGFTAALNGLSLASVFAVNSSGNLTASGDYFSAGGLTSLAGDITGNDFSITAGNILATGTTATIAGLTITNGAFGSVSELDVVGDATFGANVDITGTVTGGGIRKTTSIGAPVNPTVGDQWYKTDTDILYEYIFDGTSRYWVDLTSASVANVTASYDNLGDLTVVGNVSVTGSFNFANGTPYITTTIANTTNIVANLSNGFNVGMDLTRTGAVAGNYGSATSIPTVVVDEYGRISSITSNSVSTTVGLQGNIGTGSVVGGSTLIVQGVSNQIETTVSGSTITIGFTPNITFTDFTVSGNLVYGDNGLRSTTSSTPPTNPTNGDMWYQTGTDILYRYVNDGTSEYWLDLFSTPLRAVLPEQDIGGGDGEVQYNDNGAFGANANFSFDQVTQTLKVPRMRVTQTQSPASPTSTGLVGEITWDGDWVYVCVAPNTWRRAGLYSW